MEMIKSEIVTINLPEFDNDYSLPNLELIEFMALVHGGLMALEEGKMRYFPPKPMLIATIAVYVAKLYENAFKHLTNVVAVSPVGTLIPPQMKELLAFSANFLYANSQYLASLHYGNLAFENHRSEDMRNAVAYIRVASELMKRVQGIVESLPAPCKSMTTTSREVYEKLRESYEREKATIYNFAPIPASVSAIQPAGYATLPNINETLNKPMPIQPVFAFLDSMSLTKFQEEYAKERTSIISTAEQAEAKYQQEESEFMTANRLPECLYELLQPSASNHEIPEDLRMRIEKFQRKGGIGKMFSLLESTKLPFTTCDEDIRYFEKLLRREGQEKMRLREAYGAKYWNRPKSEVLVFLFLSSKGALIPCLA